MAQLQRVVIHPSQWAQDNIVLTTDQQHYLRRVLRLATGDRFIALDGQGHGWLAELATGAIAHPLEAISAPTELPVTVSLILALPKTGLDEVVRQTTELGVATIQPVMSDRTLLKPSAHKLDRWQRIATEAAEQSERPVVPVIRPPVPLAEGLTWGAEQGAACYICAARADAPHLLTCLTSDRPPTLTVAIGSEGGWTEAELERAIAQGYQPVSLGRRILRAVTAPVAAMTLIAGAAESAFPRPPR
ncbi:MAG: 16S rRNA (uracil(1498)-N(3))-methyltransferase [Synechococcales bacterium]|nr:16S rRNA (uracil(1498)-N(3))-methyltransferase [Synechococcales bacterium]